MALRLNKLTVSGSGTFIGMVKAPDYDITISGDGNMSGDFIANTAKISGGANAHHDEALSRLGGSGVGELTVVSWAEDVR